MLSYNLINVHPIAISWQEPGEMGKGFTVAKPKYETLWCDNACDGWVEPTTTGSQFVSLSRAFWLTNSEIWIMSS